MASIISTVSNNQQAILRAILDLYIPTQQFDLDPTYSKGAFYDDVKVPCPRFRSDLSPQTDNVMAADCRTLPMFESASLHSIVFDPPFIHAHGKESEIGNRFSSYPTQHALRAMYMASLVEFYRLLKTGGILVFKHQDIVESGKQVWNSHYIWQMATGLGFEQVDLFILVAENRMIGHNHHEQQHARKFHSYFGVYKKGPRR